MTQDEETTVVPSGPSSPSSDQTLDTEGSTKAIASPAFNDSEGVVILRTSDMVDFRVLKVILALASPVFKAMFSLPQPSVKGESFPPVVSVSETSITVDLLLRFYYSVNSPKLYVHEIPVIMVVLGAALKYNMNMAIGVAREAFNARLSMTRANALAGYAQACHLKHEEEACSAAYACLRWPLEASWR